MSPVVSYRTECVAEIDRRIAEGNDRAGQIAENHIRQVIARLGLIDTGRYIRSITHLPHEDGFIVGTDVPYAIYLELGTRYIWARRPIMTGTIEALAEMRMAYSRLG